MKKYSNRHTVTLSLVLTMAMLGLTGCTISAQSQNTSPPSAQAENLTTEQSQTASNLSATDTNAVWDEAGSTKITLSGTSISVDGSGATQNGGILTIASAGTYVITGTLTNGQIVVNATNKDKVRLVLNGANITNLTGAPIYASQCDKLIVTLADGTTNTLTDGGASFQYANTTDEEPNAALFCKDDLTINGTGTLTVNAGFNNGIGTKDDMVIVSGNLIINAANHGLRGNDSITIVNGSIQITAGNDGIQTNNTEDAAKGFILIEGGTFKIISVHDAIQAATTLTVTNGDFDIKAGGGVTKTKTSASLGTTSDSFKGLKATGDMLLTGGNFVINSYDDSIHANGNINISGGAFTLSTGDDGVHADGDLTVSGGATVITVSTSYEGLEAKTMTIADGVININSSDDGINISGGTNTGNAGRFGADSFKTSGDQWLKITGGTVTIIAGSDGIDINGSGEMTGGKVNVTAATLGEGDTIDSDGTFLRTGGTLTESGGSGMGGGAGGGRRR